jgi:hypothetical protein
LQSLFGVASCLDALFLDSSIQCSGVLVTEKT